jgi:hypothetical protein
MKVLNFEQKRLDGTVSRREMSMCDFKMRLFLLSNVPCHGNVESPVQMLVPDG